MDLQTAFYIVGLVFMGVMLVLVIALLIVVLVIKAKINKVHAIIEKRMGQVKNIGEQAGIIWRTLSHFIQK